MSRVSPTSRSWRTSPYLFAAVVAVAIGLTIVGIEMSRRLGAGQNPPANPSVRVESSADTLGAAYPRELRDGSGATLKIMARPQRIVSQTLGTDEILLAICSPDRIVGLSVFSRDPQYSCVVKQASAMSAQSVRGPEEILRLNPDLIFVAGYSRAETVELLRAAGAPVFRVTSFDHIEDIKTNIRTIGYATGDDERAEALVAQMEREINAIRARLPEGSERPRVMSYSAGFTAGANTLFDDLVRTVGAVNVSAEQGLKGFPKISAEQVAAWDPDFLVTGAGARKFDEVRRLLLSDPAIASSRAGRTGKIIVIDDCHYLAVSQYVVGAIEGLADGLYSNTPEGAK